MFKVTRALASHVLLCALTFPTASYAHPDLEVFDQTAFSSQPKTVECTLEDGSAASCYEITVNYLPKNLEIGPFCPETMADEGGIWNWTGENGKLYRVNGEFLTMLDELGYRFFDDDGTVHIVDNATQRPTVDHACINVSVDETVEITMLLPINPVIAAGPTRLGVVGKVGVALDGVPIFSDAPSVQQTGHMPALDTCGGHVDPGGWYHWHATSTDIETTFANAGVVANCNVTQDSAAQFGYAFDGFPMVGSAEADGTPALELDSCNGHVGETALGKTYHYHASQEFPNLPPCLVGVQAQNNFSTTATAGIGATRAGQDGRNEPPRPGGGGPGQLPPGFDDAAIKLGIGIEELTDALGMANGGRPNLAEAAAKLGITEAELRKILPPPPGR